MVNVWSPPLLNWVLSLYRCEYKTLIWLCGTVACVLVTSVVSDSLWFHRLQPCGLLCPWTSPGKNTGVGVFLPPFRVSSQPRDWTLVSYVSYTGRWVLYHLCYLGSPVELLPMVFPVLGIIGTHILILAINSVRRPRCSGNVLGFGTRDTGDHLHICYSFFGWFHQILKVFILQFSFL